MVGTEHAMAQVILSVNNFELEFDPTHTLRLGVELRTDAQSLLLPPPQPLPASVATESFQRSLETALHTVAERSQSLHQRLDQLCCDAEAFAHSAVNHDKKLSRSLDATL